MTSLFGRSAESGRLDEALAAVAAGTGRLVFIEGEPGIGKSALLEEVTSRARDLGFRIFAGRAEELEQDRPFRAIAEALGCTRARNDERRAEIERLLGTSSGDGAFYRLIDAFEDLLEAEALTGPTLLTIDDLQWADPGTVRSLGSIWRRMTRFRLAIIATLRRTPRSEELTSLLRSLTSQSIGITLEPLDAAAVSAIVRARAGAPPGPRLRKHIDGAGGNPLYIVELIDALRADSAIHIKGTDAEIEGPLLPPTLVLTLLHRLSALSERNLEILRNGAVLGASFRIDDLATAAEISRQVARETVKLLRNEGILTDEGEKVRFRHDLIREAVYEDLGEPVRVSMHRRIGYALASAGASPLEVAGHFLRGAHPGDTDAAGWMVDAAADPAVDPYTAAALIGRALEVNPRHPERDSLIRRLAVQLIGQGRPADAVPHLERLLSETTGMSDRLAVVERLANTNFAAGHTEALRSWIAQGAELAGQLVDTEDPETLLRVARFTFYAGGLESALDLTARAVELVRGSDGAMEAEASNQASWLLTSAGQSAKALAHSKRAVALPPLSQLTRSLYWRHHAFALGDLDRIDEAETALAVARSIAEAEGHASVELGILFESAHLRYSIGRWDDALTDAETAATISDEFDFTFAGPDPGSIASWIAYHRQDDPELSADPRIESANPPLLPTLHAVAAFDRGDMDRASQHVRDLLLRIAARPTERRCFDVLPVLSRIALAAGDTETAILGRDVAARLACVSDAPGVTLSDARCRAIVDRDVSAAWHAIELARASPRVLLAAGAFEDAAAILDRDEAVGVLGEALKLYEQTGALRDHTRVAALLQKHGMQTTTAPPPTRAVSGWGALTPAEIEVVRLAAEGLTNREIGARLFVSHRTVATHLSHVFGKLGLRSRVELAREAAQHSRSHSP